MDDLIFSARRQSAGSSTKTAETDLETRFRGLVQSPLRAGLLRYISSRPDESFGVAAVVPASQPPRYTAERPTNEAMLELLDHFLERRAAVSTEDQSPSVQR